MQRTNSLFRELWPTRVKPRIVNDGGEATTMGGAASWSIAETVATCKLKIIRPPDELFLVPKSLYFTYWAAMAFARPFFPIFYEYIGLSS
mgnify:FL=1